MAKKHNSKRTKKKTKRVNLNKLAKESIENDKKLKNKVNQTMIDYAKSKENMDLTRRITKLNLKQKKKLADKIKKKKKNLKKKSKSKKVKSGAAIDATRFVGDL
ncbi:MAG: hypothetical protein CMK44_01525 [Porticoccus sp.]|nr:hypothetical protein [Porticoccus sp.]